MPNMAIKFNNCDIFWTFLCNFGSVVCTRLPRGIGIKAFSKEGGAKRDAKPDFELKIESWGSGAADWYEIEGHRN